MTLADARPTLLLVDDDPLNIRVLAEVLQGVGDIKVATSAARALELCMGQEPPDLVLLDVVMPEMSGYDVCRTLKEHERTRHIPVIFVTALGDEDDEETGFKVGAVDYISKPFKSTLVRARVSTHLRLKRQADLLERLLAQDALTEIHNRRKFDQALDMEWRRCARADAPLSVVLLDVDHFKAFNDTLGHTVGDECLRSVAKALQSALFRPGDTLARYGGEEFVAVLPATDSAGAQEVAERFRSSVEAMQTPHPSSRTADVVTVSVGVATLHPAGVQDAPQVLTEHADAALYEAKNSGRNRVKAALGVGPIHIGDDVNRATAVNDDRVGHDVDSKAEVG